METFETVVIGGGPAGATAAETLAGRGRSVLMIDRRGRIKPCGGAIPPRLIQDFRIPDHLLACKVRSARMISPTGRRVDMPIDNGFVGMVDREIFDEWLRERATSAGAARTDGTVVTIDREPQGGYRIGYREKEGDRTIRYVRSHTLVGADGANSTTARLLMPAAERPPFVFAYHEIISTEGLAPDKLDSERCDVLYDGRLSPDFYAWVFPHGATASIGLGSAAKGFPLRETVGDLRERIGLAQCETIRREGAPIPLKPRRRWDDGQGLVLTGDAAGLVAPASGEGIYYAMYGGKVAADAVEARLATGRGRALATARKTFMREHGRVFWVLGLLQHFFYRNDRRRERFVSICKDPDVQRLTWESYMNKRLVRSAPGAHFRIFLKDVAHLTGLAPAR